MMEKEEVSIISICIYYFLLNKDRIYEWIKRFVTTGPNGKIRPFNLNDLMEDNKILNLSYWNNLKKIQQEKDLKAKADKGEIGD